jgi:hypothetical protein
MAAIGEKQMAVDTASRWPDRRLRSVARLLLSGTDRETAIGATAALWLATLRCVASRTVEARCDAAPGVLGGCGAERDLPRVLGKPGEETLVVEVSQREGGGRAAAGDQPADELMVER